MSDVVIGDILPYTQAIAVGAQTVFGTNWTADAASDVVVYKTPSGDEANDATQILAYPAGYSVAFIGAQEQVQVTLVVPASAGDRITITRQTPADRMNLYSNTNFVPSMLNNDFGILTLVDQQAQLVDQKIGPRYNYSALIVDIVDTILPVLEPGQTWIKNAAGTAIIGADLPTSGFAPLDMTYLTSTDESTFLPNSFQLVAGSGVTFVTSPNTITINSTGMGGTVTSITANNGLTATPNPIIGAGSIGLASIATLTGLVNTTVGVAVPIATTLSAWMDAALGSTRGDILYRNNTVWTVLAPSTAGFSLQTGGAGADPAYSNTFTNSTLVTPATLGVQQQALNMGGFIINNGVTPSVGSDYAIKSYVDTVAAGLQSAGPVERATTADVPCTYNNGVAGVGATITVTATGVLSLDGGAVVVGKRYLFKNQGTGFQNGIYDCNNDGAAATNPLFTRSLDYNTPQEINDTGIVPVIAGTTQANTGWYETATITTIGTDALTYIQFGNTGTVTSVTFTGDGVVLSSTPSAAVTTSGTLTASLKTQVANTVFAGPTTGADANPTFRALVAADFPSWQTFTPTITLVGGAGNTVPVYTTNSGRFCQFGKTVFVAVSCFGDGGAEGAGTGRINVALPVQASASIPNASPNSSGFAVGYANNNTTEYQLYGIITASATTMGLEYFNTVPTTASFTGADQNNTSRQFNLQFFYESV